MTYYYVNIYWKEEWSPVYITTNEEEAEKLYNELKNNWEGSAESYNLDIEKDIVIDTKDIDGTLIYDSDWFEI